MSKERGSSPQDSSLTEHQHNSDAESASKQESSSRLRPPRPTVVAELVTWLYIHVVLLNYPRSYNLVTLREEFGIRREHRHLISNTRGVKLISPSVIGTCNMAMIMGCISLCVGGFVVNYSSGPYTAMLGPIVMVIGTYATMIAFRVYLYTSLVARYTYISDINAGGDDAIRQIAMVFAVPLSSVAWCTIGMFTAIMAYALDSFNAPRQRHSSTSTSFPSPTVAAAGAAHTSALKTQTPFGLVACCCILHYLFVLRSTLRLSKVRNFTPDPAKPASSTLEHI